jgi:hypothetical protein
LTVGGRLPKHPSVSQLTSRPDSVLSKCRRSRHPIPTQIATAPGGKRSSIVVCSFEMPAALGVLLLDRNQLTLIVLLRIMFFDQQHRRP